MENEEVVVKRIVLVLSIILGVGLVLSPLAQAQVVQTLLDPAGIPKFVNPLPLLGPTGLPVLDGTVPATISICEFQAQVLPAPMAKTWVWGYQIGDTCNPDPGHAYIGPVVVAQRGTPTNLTFINQLPDADPYGLLGSPNPSNVLAFTQNTDQTMHWADPTNFQDNACSEALSQGFLYPSPECTLNYTGPVAAAVHLHGGEVPPDLDGGPDSWWTTDGTMRGHGYYTREVENLPSLPNADFPSGVMVLNKDTAGAGNAGYHRNDFESWTPTTDIDRATYVYPNTQEAANIWFHDHVLGMTRLNVYAGIAGAYVIQDPGATNPDLGPVTNLVPLVIQDRFFDTNGQLFFGAGGTTPEHPWWVPEFIGDVAVVNGAAWPTMTVEPKRYRFLFLNGSNSRGYDFFLFKPAGTKPNGKPSKAKFGPSMYVIGTDGGYLDAPATINPRNDTPGNPAKLVMMPGERYEVIVDFSGFAGQTLELQNTAFNPYPFGPEPPIAQIMQFQVANAVTSPGVAYDPTLYDPLNPATSPRVAPIESLAPLAAAPAVRRQLTLNEIASKLTDTPLEALLNNTKWNGFQVLEDGDGVTIPNTIQPRLDFVEAFEDYLDPTYYSELPGEGTMEVWEIINITADAHPIHLHLVQFQILDRQPIDPICYNDIYNMSFPSALFEPGYGPPNDYNILNADGAIGGNPAPSPCFVGAPRAAGAFESGWKDTAVMYPDEVTRIAVRWAPTDVPNTVTDMTQLGFPFDPNHGHGYVWHCHILDHEDSEMMRPTQVNTNTLFPPADRSFVKGLDY